MTTDVVQNLIGVRKRVADAGRKYRLDIECNPEIIAVSKTHDADSIRPLLEAGHRVFGENRVQEAMSKWPALKVDYPGVELHLIGALQTNKVKDALRLFDVIQTVDRPKLAGVLAKQLAKGDYHDKKFFIQINTGEEEQKAGIIPQEADDFIGYCAGELGLPVVGLMCIPPVDDNPALHFALLKKIAERNNLPELSMGMSGDFELAAAMGATYVRVGTAIFDTRG